MTAIIVPPLESRMLVLCDPRSVAACHDSMDTARRRLTPSPDREIGQCADPLVKSKGWALD